MLLTRRRWLEVVGLGALAAGGPARAAGPALDLRAFGCDGTGRQDDSERVLAAQATALQQGSSLYFPPGRYRLSDRVMQLEASKRWGFPVKVSWRGAGGGGSRILYDSRGGGRDSRGLSISSDILQRPRQLGFPAPSQAPRLVLEDQPAGRAEVRAMAGGSFDGLSKGDAVWVACGKDVVDADDNLWDEWGGFTIRAIDRGSRRITLDGPVPFALRTDAFRPDGAMAAPIFTTAELFDTTRPVLERGQLFWVDRGGRDLALYRAEAKGRVASWRDGKARSPLDSSHVTSVAFAGDLGLEGAGRLPLYFAGGDPIASASGIVSQTGDNLVADLASPGRGYLRPPDIFLAGPTPAGLRASAQLNGIPVTRICTSLKGEFGRNTPQNQDYRPILQRIPDPVRDVWIEDLEIEGVGKEAAYTPYSIRGSIRDCGVRRVSFFGRFRTFGMVAEAAQQITIEDTDGTGAEIVAGGPTGGRIFGAYLARQVTVRRHRAQAARGRTGAVYLEAKAEVSFEGCDFRDGPDGGGGGKEDGLDACFFNDRAQLAVQGSRLTGFTHPFCSNISIAFREYRRPPEDFFGYRIAPDNEIVTDATGFRRYGIEPGEALPGGRFTVQARGRANAARSEGSTAQLRYDVASFELTLKGGGEGAGAPPTLRRRGGQTVDLRSGSLILLGVGLTWLDPPATGRGVIRLSPTATSRKGDRRRGLLWEDYRKFEQAVLVSPTSPTASAFDGSGGTPRLVRLADEGLDLTPQVMGTLDTAPRVRVDLFALLPS